MSSPNIRHSAPGSSSHPHRLSQSQLPLHSSSPPAYVARTTTPSTPPRRRNNSHLTSSIFAPRPSMTSSQSVAERTQSQSQSQSHAHLFRPAASSYTSSFSAMMGHGGGRGSSHSHSHSATFAPSSLGEIEVGPIHKEVNITKFEWQLPSIQELVNYLEDGNIGGEGDAQDDIPDCFKRGVLIGRGRHKLELARGDDENLILYVGVLWSGARDTEEPFSELTVALRPTSQPIGQKHAATQWSWTHTEEFDYSIDTEVIEVHLPKLTDLILAQTDVGAQAEADAEAVKKDSSYSLNLHQPISLCVDITATPSVKPDFRLEEGVVVPQSILGALGSMLDDTEGTIRFVCLQHSREAPTPAPSDEVFLVTAASAGPGANMSGWTLRSRKRTIYAHAKVLQGRSEYFKDLLAGGFSETQMGKGTSSRYTTITVDDADFETLYWTLRYIHTNELSFSEGNGDVRDIMERLALDRTEILRALMEPSPYTGHSEWEYRSLRSEVDGDNMSISDMLESADFDTRTISSVGTSVSRKVTGQGPAPGPGPGYGHDGENVKSGISATRPRAPSSASATPSAGGSRSSTTSSLATSSRSVVNASTASTLSPRIPSRATTSRIPTHSPAPTTTTKPSVRRTSPETRSTPTGKQAVGTAGRTSYPYRMPEPEPDPHPHPVPPPKPASALAVYMLAHRYRLDGLCALAKEHILLYLRGWNCMPILLATYQYSQIHDDVLDYIIENWQTVRTDDDFHKCIQEVSAGVWGETGGMVLSELFSRLASPPGVQ